MQTIVFVRHAYPIAWDERLPVRGTPPHRRLDSGLADIGRQQAALTAAHIADSGDVGVVISSPFRRCLETADAIAAGCGVTVTSDWRVGDVLLSTVLGSPFSPTSTMDPDWAERRAGAGKPSHPESDLTIQERVAKMVNDLKARKPFKQRIVVVSHDIIMKHLIQRMTGRAVTCDWHPAGLATLVLAKPADRNWRLQGAPGSVTHLGDADRTEPMEYATYKYHPDDSRM